MDKINGKELKLAGTVIDFSHKVSKNSGKPFGTFKLEDYEESFEFILFGEEYLKYKHFFHPGEKLFVTGRVQPRRFGQEVNGMEFRINSIELLSDIRDKRARFIDITVNIDMLSDKLIQQLMDTIPNGEGKSTLRINIETNDTAALKLPSSTFNKINVTTDVLNALDELPIEVAIKEA